MSKCRSKILSYLLFLTFIILFHTTYAKVSICVFFFAFIFFDFFSFALFFRIFLFQLIFFTLTFFQILHFLCFYSFFWIPLFFSSVFFHFWSTLTLNHGIKKVKHPCGPCFFHGHQTCDCKHFGIIVACFKWTKCCIDDEVSFIMERSSLKNRMVCKAIRGLEDSWSNTIWVFF